MISSSRRRVLPPRQQPSGTPSAMPMPTAISATAMEVRAPTMIIENMSRPK
jgi:hypothetical protein